MKYIIDRGWFFSSTEFEILTEARQKAYHVTSEFFSWGFSLTLADAAGQVLLKVREDMGSLQNVFQIYRGEELFATVTRESWGKTYYRVMVGEERAFSVQPNFWGTNFDFVNEEGRLAVFRKPILSFRYPMELEIFDERQELLAVAATLSVLKTIDRRNRSENNNTLLDRYERKF